MNHQRIHVVSASPGLADRPWAIDGYLETILGIWRLAGIDCINSFVRNSNEVRKLSFSDDDVAFPNSHFIGPRRVANLLPQLIEMNRRIAMYVTRPASFLVLSDKALSKIYLSECGLNKLRFRAGLGDIQLRTKGPGPSGMNILKPRYGSCSIDVSQQLHADVYDAQGSVPTNYIYEAFERQHEYTASFISRGSTFLYAIVEVTGLSEPFFSLNEKRRDVSRFLSPVSDPVKLLQLHKLCRSVLSNFELGGLFRVDIVEDGTGALHILEVNLLPGLNNDSNDLSIFPSSFRKTLDFTYEEVIRLIGESALMIREPLTGIVNADLTFSRLATIDDLVSVMEILRGEFGKYRNTMGLAETPRAEERLRNAVISGHVVVQQMGSKIIAAAEYQFRENAMHLALLAVTEGLQGRGIGRRLLGNIVGIARENRCEYIEVEVIAAYFSAVQFYLSNDFEFTRTYVRREQGKGIHRYVLRRRV